MEKSIQSLKKDISTLRTGRANIHMLDTIKVDVYGQKMPIEQLATVSVPEARLISIQVWDKANINLIESAIQKSELGINPQTDGQMIRLRIPDLTEERRKELIKVLKNMGEKGKVSIRNIRREANEELKKKLKDKIISEDQNKNFEKNIQKLTDTNIENISEGLVPDTLDFRPPRQAEERLCAETYRAVARRSVWRKNLLPLHNPSDCGPQHPHRKAPRNERASLLCILPEKGS